MSNQMLPIEFARTVEFTIPEFDCRPEIRLVMQNIYAGENRMVEAKIINPALYGDLEVLFTQGESEARRLTATVGYELAQAKKILKRVESELLLDEWPEFRKERGLSDNGAMRNAFLSKNEKYVAAQDRIDMLIALESLLDGKVKIFQEARRHMRKQIDIMLKGIALNKY